VFLLLSFRGVKSCDHTHGPMLIVTCLLASKLHCPDGVPASGVPLDSRLLPNRASLVWHNFFSAQCQPHDLPSVVYEQNATIEGSSSASLTSLNSCRNINLFERICPSAIGHFSLVADSCAHYHSITGQHLFCGNSTNESGIQPNGVLVLFRPFSSPAV